MSASNLINIARQAVQQGWKKDTPALLSHDMYGEKESLTYTTLREIITTPREYPTPLMVIIGNVVHLSQIPSEKLMKPTILVTGTNPASFQQYGDIIHTPLIEIKPYSDPNVQKPIMESLKNFRWIIFTSRHAVHYFMELLIKSNQDTRSLAGIQLASIGKITTATLKITV